MGSGTAGAGAEPPICDGEPFVQDGCFAQPYELDPLDWTLEVPCEFAFPRPEAGAEYATDEMRIAYTAPDGELRELGPYVGDEQSCEPTVGGWYFGESNDDENTYFLALCPCSCAALGPDAKLAIAVSCSPTIVE